MFHKKLKLSIFHLTHQIIFDIILISKFLSLLRNWGQRSSKFGIISIVLSGSVCGSSPHSNVCGLGAFTALISDGKIGSKKSF